MNVVVLSNGIMRVRDVASTGFNEIVGGYLEIPYMGSDLYDNKIDIIINEEGKLIDGLRKEIVLIDRVTGELVNFIYGSCIFASYDEDGEITGLSEEQIDKVYELLLQTIKFTDGTIVHALYI